MSDKRSKQTIEKQLKNNRSDKEELELIKSQTTVPEIKPYLDVAISQIAQSISLDKLILEIEFKDGETYENWNISSIL